MNYKLKQGETNAYNLLFIATVKQKMIVVLGLYFGIDATRKVLATPDL